MKENPAFDKLKPREREILRHCLCGDGGDTYRNYFQIGKWERCERTENYETLERMVDKGLLWRREPENFDWIVYHATTEGVRVSGVCAVLPPESGALF